MDWRTPVSIGLIVLGALTLLMAATVAVEPWLEGVGFFLLIGLAWIALHRDLDTRTTMGAMALTVTAILAAEVDLAGTALTTARVVAGLAILGFGIGEL